MGFHKSQVFLYLLSAFIAGVFLASVFDFSQSLICILLIVSISAVALWGFKNRLVLLLVFMLLVLIFGGVRFNSFNNSKDNLENFVGQDVKLIGYIDSEPEINGKIQRFILSTRDNRILVTVGSYPRYKFGDVIAVEGNLELPQNFGEFDYITYLKKEGVRTVLFFPIISRYSGNLNLSLSDKLRLAIYKKVFTVKDNFEQAINLSMTEPNASFVNGILLGSRQNISQDLKEAFKKTGTTHILAISGYNIMVISEAVLLGLIFFVRRRVAFWMSVGVIFLFVVMTGASASVVRAATMGLLLSFAHGYGRLYDQKNSIIFAGAMMIWVNPLVLVFDIGFQLSFAAVLGLIYLYPWLEHRFDKFVPILYPDSKDRGLSIAKQSEQNRGSSISQTNQNDLGEIGSGLKELILMTLSAQIAVAPLLVYYFGGISPISLPANILILPFVPASMFLGFITGLAGMVSISLGQLIGYLVWAVTTYQIRVVELLAGLV